MAASYTQFGEQFVALTGNEPYPWQCELFERFARGETCDALDIPTGLGKTSVIAVWLLAHLLGEDATRRPPMRLVYVVNRRTVVGARTILICWRRPG